MTGVIVTFVAQSEYDVSSVLHMAFDQSKLQYNLDPKWATVDECLKIEKSKLLKTDVFVFEEFSGDAFKHLLNTKAVIIGTRCLLKCLSQAKELPPWTHPIYSLAMEGMVITSSGIKKEEKDKIKQYVEWMGGVYDKDLHQKTTQLISNNVTSVKYSTAAETIPVMRPEWVEAIWESSNRDTIVGDCKDFLQESLRTYRLKPFHGLHITTSSLSRADRDKVKNCVEANGGTYMGNYKGDLTDVVVLTQAGVNSAKYNAARSAKKECITPDWIYDSDKSGYSLSMDLYRVGAKSSTPTKSNTNMNLDKNFSMMSTLNESAHNAITSVSESMSVTCANSFISFPKPTIADVTFKTNTTKTGLRNMFDMKEVRKAGLFLDGCGIYLSGFSTEDRELLNRVLNSGGATRYDDASERISHVVIGNPSSLAMQPFQEKGLSPFFVNIEWLVQSVKEKKPTLEDDFIVKETQTKSCNKTCGKPMDFPGSLLDETFSPRVERLKEIENKSKVLDMYKNASIKLPDPTLESTMETSTEESTIKSYLTDVTFYLYDLDDKTHKEVQAHIVDAGGNIVNSMHKTDYVVAPELCSKEITVKEKCQLVSPLFIRSCLEQNAHIQVQYYHRPIMQTINKPLKGLVFTVSSYTGLERYFIGELSKELGATFMDTMVKKPNLAKNVPATTHLICKQANGQKYNACLLWKLPGVSVMWLLECARTQTRVHEQKYLVGDTKSPLRLDISSGNSTTIDERTLCNSTIEGINQVLDAKSSPRANLKRTRTSCDEYSSEENDINVPLNVNKMQTPIVNKLLSNVSKTSPAQTQETPPPVSKILQRLRQQNSDTPESPGLPPLPEYMRTPDSPYGAFLYDNPTPETRKRWKRFCDGLPSPDTPLPQKTPSPTWSAVKREAWAALLKPRNLQQNKVIRLNFEEDARQDGDGKLGNSSHNIKKATAEPPKALIGVNTQVQKLNALLTSGGLGGNIPNNRTLTPISRKPSLHNIDTINYEGVVKESQAESVGWRDPSELESVKESYISDSGLEEMQPFRKRPPRFLLSGVQAKEEIAESVAALGGELCDTDGSQYDPSCSHILSDAPGRSEKILGGLSSGKWILSTLYITHCMEEGRFVEEEYFEWGNPTGNFNRSEGQKNDADACYRWRCKFNNKPVENSSDGAFTGWKVLLYTERKTSFERLIQAGFGEVVNCKNIESLQEGSVTHCFCEPRKKNISTDEIRHLNRLGVQVLPVQYLNRYLMDHPIPNPKDHLITV